MSSFDLNSPFHFTTRHCANRDQFLQHLGEIERSEDSTDRHARIAEFIKNNSDWIAPSDVKLVERVKVLTGNQQADTINELAKSQSIGQKSAIENALASARSDPGGTAERIQEFGITDQEALINIAKICADGDSNATAENIRNFGIKSPIARIDIARICAEQTLECTAPHLANFDIPLEFQDELIELFKLCAAQNADETVEYFAEFGITDKSFYPASAIHCIQEGANDIEAIITNFLIHTESDLIELATALARKNPLGILRSLHLFNFESEVEKLKLAKLCVDLQPIETIKNLSGFHLRAETGKEFAKYCAQKIPLLTFIDLELFSLPSNESKQEIRLLCIQKASKEILTELNNVGCQAYGMNDAEYRKLKNACLRSSLDNLELMRSNPILFVQVPRDSASMKGFELKLAQCLDEMKLNIDQLPLADEAKHSLKQIIEEISSNKDAFIKQSSAKWFLGCLRLMHDMKAEAIYGAVSSLKDLVNMPEPRLRWELATSLLDHCEDEKLHLSWNHLSMHKRLGLLSIPFMGLEIAGVNLEQLSSLENDLKKLVNKSKSPLKDDKAIRNLLAPLHSLSSFHSLTKVDLENTLKQIFYDKEGKLLHDSEMFQNLNLVRNIICMGGMSKLGKNEDFKTILLELFKQEFALSSFEGDLLKALEERIPSDEHRDLLMTYASTLKTKNDPRLMESFGEILQAILENRFRELRYSFDNNPHLTKLFKGREELLKTWREPIQFNLDVSSEEVHFNPKEWLRANLFNHLNIGHVHIDELKELLKNEKSLALIGSKMRGLKKGSAEQVALKFQQECIKMSRLNERAHTNDILTAVSNIVEVMKSGGEAFTESLFFREIQQLQKDLQNKRSQPLDKMVHGLSVKLMDEPFEILGGGNLEGSCLAVANDVSYSQGLLGILRNGMTQMIGVFDAQGKLLSRAWLRIPLDEPDSNPVLLLEPMYPARLSQDQQEALLRAAKIKAQQMKLPLVSSIKSEREYPLQLAFIGGPAPYDYSDAAGGGAREGGVFKIEKIYLVD